MFKYVNGNCTIALLDDGTRIITSKDDEMNLEFPLNIDIRVSTKCQYGLNPKTNKAKCEFCHESAITNGRECDYDRLLEVLAPMPSGLELAIGVNHLSKSLEKFLISVKDRFVVNITVNSYMTENINNTDVLVGWIKSGLVKGVGVSYRKGAHIPNKLKQYKNMVVHVINGIDAFDDVLALSKQGINKLLILGEKDFGFNKNKVNTASKSHVEWHERLKEIIDAFNIVSFDNLGLEQLDLKRFLKNNEWEEFYQGEHSMYINAVDEYFAPSSRSEQKKPWGDLSIKDFFYVLENENIPKD